MGSITVFNGSGKLIFYDSGHTHEGCNDYHVHEVDLSKLTMNDLEKLERDSRNGWIELHDWKKIPGALHTRNATQTEIDYINKMLKLKKYWVLRDYFIIKMSSLF